MKHPLLYLFIALAPSLTLAETLYGRVVGVSDGDTVTLLPDGNRQERYIYM